MGNQYIGIEEIAQYLEPIIKKDEIAKVVAFLVQFSTYLLEDQLNSIIASLSSTGKTHILINIADLFPEEDVIRIGYSSPKAFFHELGRFDQKTKKLYIDLSHKNLIFLDQPHPELLARLRPILSHDKKEIEIKITDKNLAGSIRTKSVIIRGYPAVSFATTYLKLDDQEITRALIISPEISEEKIKESLELIAKEKTIKDFQEIIKNDAGLNILKQRILSFKQIAPEIKNIQFEISKEELLKIYLDGKRCSHKDLRNFKKFSILAECFAALNWVLDRVKEGVLYVKMEDIMEAKKLWAEIGKYQEVGVMPFAVDVYYKVILELHNQGHTLTKKVLMGGIREKMGTSIQPLYLEQQILPALEAGGVISIEKNPQDKRQIIVIPLVDIQKFSENSVKNSGENFNLSDLYLW